MLEEDRTAGDQRRKKEIMVTTFVVAILTLSAVLAFASRPGEFQATILVFSILVASVIYVASRYGGQSPLWISPVEMAQALRQLRHDMQALRRLLGSATNAGSNSRPQCGARLT